MTTHAPMSLREQYKIQLERARIVMLDARAPVELYVVKYDGIPARVSIVGGAISYCAPELWRNQGARCHRICTVSRAKA